MFLLLDHFLYAGDMQHQGLLELLLRAIGPYLCDLEPVVEGVQGIVSVVLDCLVFDRMNLVPVELLVVGGHLHAPHGV